MPTFLVAPLSETAHALVLGESHGRRGPGLNVPPELQMDDFVEGLNVLLLVV